MSENNEKAKALPVPNRERIAAWVAALRSGEYQQGREALRVGDTFCCLGVACDVTRKQTGKGVWIGDQFSLDGQHSNSVLPGTVQEWYGLEDVNPGGGAVGRYSDSLAELNDAGKRFSEIAAVIEAKYLTPEPAS